MNSSVENVDEGEGEGAGIESGIEGERTSERMKEEGWTGIDGYYDHIGPIRTRKSSRLVYISIIPTRRSELYFSQVSYTYFFPLYIYIYISIISLQNFYQKISYRVNLLTLKLIDNLRVR